MARKASSSKVIKPAPVHRGEFGFALDDFTLPSLVEARLRKIPLTDEETQLLKYIKEDDALRQEYYGLLAVMRTLEQSPDEQLTASLDYLLLDATNKLYPLTQNQLYYQKFLVEENTRLVGAASDKLGIFALNRYELAELGLVLDFQQAGQVRLATWQASPDVRRVAENKAPYSAHSTSTFNPAEWQLQLETSSGKLITHHFDSSGSLDLAMQPEEIVGWQLLYQSSQRLETE